MPAIYAGCILSLLPLLGTQILLGFILAFILRCNLVVMIGLQMISNPLTVGPIWFANYIVGDFFLSMFSVETLSVNAEGIKIPAASSGVFMTLLKKDLQNLIVRTRPKERGIRPRLRNERVGNRKWHSLESEYEISVQVFWGNLFRRHHNWVFSWLHIEFLLSICS